MTKVQMVAMNAEETRRDREEMAARLSCDQGACQSAPAVRLSKASDGLWYVDVRRTATGAFRSDSRHGTLDDALERVRTAFAVQEVAR